MLLKYFYDERLAQASYMVGCAKTGEALIVDPSRAIQPYLDAAKKEGLTITHVTETHIHADCVSGSRELAHATDATIFLSGMGDAAWQYGFANQPNVTTVKDGDSWMVGNIKIEVLHTPGHTPEHISFMITDTAGANKPMGVFTGDFLFVGNVGRPDLLEEAAGIAGTADSGARQQYHSVQRFRDLPDYLQVWPGHGAGSACGKGLGSIPSSTLGYEKLFNPAFQHNNEDEFAEWLLDGQPAAPRYFAQMKKVNKEGPALLNELPKPQPMDRIKLSDLLEEEALVIDFRNRNEFSQSHIPGTVSVPASNKSFSTFVGWFVDYKEPFYMIAADDSGSQDIISALQAIGIDNVAGIFAPSVVDGYTDALPQLSSQELADRLSQNDALVIDVRGPGEFAEEHIEGARNIVLGYLPDHLDELPKDKTIAIQCASGYRALVGASYLRKQGYSNAVLMGDPHSAWSKALPTVVG